MGETVQIILAVGAAVFLGGVIVVAGIWAVRCRPDSATYRNPLRILSIPAVLALIYFVDHVLR